VSLRLIGAAPIGTGMDADLRRRLYVARAGALLFTGQGLLAALAVSLGMRSESVVYWIAGAAVVTGVLLWFGWRVLTNTLSQVFAAIGLGMIGVIVAFTDADFGLLYPAVACVIALLFPLRWAIAQNCWLLAVYALALYVNPDEGVGAAWVLLAGALAVLFLVVEQLRRRTAALAERRWEHEELLEAIFANAPLGIALYDLDLRYVRVNETTARLAGRRPDEFPGRHLDEIHPGNASRIAPVVEQIVATGLPMLGREVRRGGRHLRGSHYPLRNADGEIRLIAAITDDVTELKDAEATLEDLLHKEQAARFELERARWKLTARNRELAVRATTDPLTKLANRAGFDEQLADAIERADRDGSCVGLVFVDLDGFKRVNDRHGHSAGDELLGLVARRLLSHRRNRDLVARIGGDEFVILLADLAERTAVETVTTIATRLHASISEPVVLSDATVRVTCSVGTSVYPRDASTAAELLALADDAMYRRKRAS
jgi:diguanylate cyclase (GGDEF)-like protein/PAS domain S-box-containing protein